MSPRPSPPSLSRGEIRPVARRTRTFRPNYLSFAGTYQCNLSCAHCCVPIEWPDRLDIPTAVRFLEQAAAYGIGILGFTGGEPFLYPEFLHTLCRRAVELGLRFDKIMTNGVWFTDEQNLEKTLQRLADTGFNGKLGVSIDKFHGRHLDSLIQFCRAARRIFERDNIISLSYASRQPDVGLEPIQALAERLDGIIEWSDLLGRYLLVAPDLTMVLNWNHLAPVERAEHFQGAWDGTWFEEDYCEGPGQALIVTPRGEVKPCCGFASDLEQLTIGNIYKDTVAEIVRRARKDPVVGTIFRRGLSALREEILATDPAALPGETSNHCFFCWYVLSKRLYPAGGAPRFAGCAKTVGLRSLAVVEPDPETSFLMRFDGRQVFLGPTLPDGKGRVYRLRCVAGTPRFPTRPLSWDAYQAWLEEQRATGCRFATEEELPSPGMSLKLKAGM